MNEQEWLTCTDPKAMLEFLLGSGRTSERKLRLLAAACCRYLSDWLKDERCQGILEAIERFADGKTTRATLKRARQSVRAIRGNLATEEVAVWSACWIVEVAAAEKAYTHTPLQLLGSARHFLDEPVHMVVFVCDSIMEIFGNPFRPVALDPAWQFPSVVSLAQAAHDERILPAGSLDPLRLAVLADALEEAGCEDDDILDHLRGHGPHARGCWAVDALLRRS